MRQKIIDRGQRFQEAEIVESWSKARLLAAFVVVLGFGALTYIGFTKAHDKAVAVLGVETSKVNTQNVHLPNQDDANKLLEDAKNEINNLTSSNLTSSQAAIQKVINDLKALQDGKGNPTDMICQTICGK